VQEERNTIVVRLEALPGAEVDTDEVLKRLRERLSSVGLREHLDVRIEFVPKLDWDWRTGKFRRLVSRVGPPSDLPADRPAGTLVHAGRESAADLAPSTIADG
jgi:hypothetical protein